MEYKIKVSDSGELTRHEWSTDGYQLMMVTHADSEPMFTVSSPTNTISIVIDNFDNERRVEIDWAPIGVTSLETATEFAENINEAVRVAGDFQKIVDCFK